MRWLLLSLRLFPPPVSAPMTLPTAPLSDRFIAHLLARNIRLEEDLIDRLFNASEKRLARNSASDR
jgi:hypothetical protein